jgi:HD-like signal output (HDOD) protein/ActR/RegA family two-component response regulator
MKKRICFVDDESKALNALKQAMAGISGTWDCTFVSDAPAALAAMAAQPFDAVVTNMQIQGMNGAELLQEVGKLHPRTLRFVVGDVADQELIINCIGGTHQFIARPYNPQVLMSTVQRSLALDAWLSTDQLRALVPRLHRLPSLPSTYFEVLKQVESPGTSAQNIGEVIARDPVVTARLLQMVNSASLALSQKITDPVDAVSLLGMETVKSLVLCLQVFSQNDEAKKAGISFDRLWAHSFAVANIARKIIMFESGDTRMANDAFTAGLLHDVGRIVLASNLPVEYAAVIAAARKNVRALNDEEAAQLGVTHAEVGAYLLSLWGMPAPLVEAAALHHTPSHTFTNELSLLTVVHVANVFAHEHDTHNDGMPVSKLDMAHLDSLVLTNKLDAWRNMLAGEKRQPESKTASRPVRAGAVQPATQKPVASRRENNWLSKLAIPAAAVAAVVAVVAGLVWCVGKMNSDEPIRVQARTVAEPASTIQDPAAATPIETVADTKSVTPRAVASVTPVAETIPVVSKPVVITKTPVLGFDSVKVQGIFYRTTGSSVIINGKSLNCGERINGVEVVAIESSSVTLASGTEQKIFRVK